MRAGDHIRITRGGVSEHAIEVGDRTVIHFVQGEGVRRSRLYQLAPDGARVEVVVHPHRVYVPKQVVARAFSRFSDSAYAAMFRDSEEFASWCKTGKVPARPLAPSRAPTSSERAPRAAKPARAGRAALSPARTAPRANAKKPRTGKGARLAAAPAKAARSAKPAASAKRRAPAKLARGAKKVAKASASRKPARASRSSAKAPAPARGRKRLSSSGSRPAKSQKKRAAPASAKQKRRKTQSKRAATGR